MFLKFVGIILILTTTLESTSWLERKAEGWAWYEDIQKNDDEKISKTASDEIRDIRHDLEEKLSTALLKPSEENIRSYMKLQQKWINQSANFAMIWSQILLNSPELDSTINHPVSQYGIQLRKKEDEDLRKMFIQDLASKNGLFFFYEGNNKISQAQSLVVSTFINEYGWNIMPISVDGIILSNFPGSKKDNGITKKMNVPLFPALYVVSPNDSVAFPIAFGFATLDQIEKNIELQYQKIQKP